LKPSFFQEGDSWDESVRKKCASQWWGVGRRGKEGGEGGKMTVSVEEREQGLGEAKKRLAKQKGGGEKRET